jgi:protein SCO1/2
MTLNTLTRREALRGLAGACLGIGALAVAHGAPAPTPAAAALPALSIYHLDVGLVDQDGRPFHLADFRGGPVLASMFYSSCDMVCPLIFETIKAHLAEAGPRVREATRVLMVSFDPERDTQAVLKETAAAHGADARWTLANGTPDAVRQVAAVMGIQYRRLAGGAFNHSSVIELLDADGAITARTTKLGEIDPALVAALKGAVRA